MGSAPPISKQQVRHLSSVDLTSPHGTTFSKGPVGNKMCQGETQCMTIAATAACQVKQPSGWPGGSARFLSNQYGQKGKGHDKTLWLRVCLKETDCACSRAKCITTAYGCFGKMWFGMCLSTLSTCPQYTEDNVHEQAAIVPATHHGFITLWLSKYPSLLAPARPRPPRPPQSPFCTIARCFKINETIMGSSDHKKHDWITE